MGRERPGWAPDTASVGVMDVEKSNPSQGGQVTPWRQRVQTIWPWKELPFFFFFFPICAKKLQYPAILY